STVVSPYPVSYSLSLHDALPIFGIASIVLGILAMTQNVAFLASLAFAIAASANLPTILYSLYWRRFNTTGAVASIYGGLISCLRSEEHTSELQSRFDLVCRLLLE